MSHIPLPPTTTIAAPGDTATDDPIEILGWAARWRREGAAVVLVTLIDIQLGAARAIGAQMAIREDGIYAGQVSGGCVEGSIVREAQSAIAAERDRDIAFGKGSPWFDVQLPCGGGIGLSLHVVRDGSRLEQLVTHSRKRGIGALQYERATERLIFEPTDASAVTLASETGWTRIYRPKTRLSVFGAGVEAEATMRLAKAMGYEVQQCEARGATLDLFDADTAVVLLHHDIELDACALNAVLSAKPFYIGALGSRSTHARRQQLLADRGFAREDLARIRAPIGLIDRTRDSSTLAISVLAEIAMIRSFNSPQ